MRFVRVLKVPYFLTLILKDPRTFTTTFGSFAALDKTMLTGFEDKAKRGAVFLQILPCLSRQSNTPCAGLMWKRLNWTRGLQYRIAALLLRLPQTSARRRAYVGPEQPKFILRVCIVIALTK